MTMAENLSDADVKKLLNDPSANTRADTAVKLAENFSAGTLSAQEREIAEEIIRKMAHDAADLVREALSAHLKENPDLPADIALTLARDIDSVSLPMLQFSLALSDQDLVDIVKTQSVEKQIAVANRPVVSEKVADALVETNNEDVVSDLVANNGADLSEKSMQKVLDKFGDSERVNAPMAKRKQLPVAATERLVSMVSDTIREHLVTNHELPADIASDIILQSRERATLGLLTPSTDALDVETLIAQLHAGDRLTPTIILRAICMGDMTFFECAVAQLAGVPADSAHILIHDQGRLGLPAIYDKAGLPKAFFPAIRAAIEVGEENEYDGGDHDRERFRRRMIERLLTNFDDPNSKIEAEDIDYLFDKMNQIGAPIALPA